MNIALKVIGGIIIVVIVSAAAGYLYLLRQQSIDIDLIPNEFTRCGKQIWGNDPEYKEIVQWLKENQDGWVLSFTSYLPRHSYSAPAYKVIFINGGVAVSYKTDYGYPQYAKSVNHGYIKQCATNS